MAGPSLASSSVSRPPFQMLQTCVPLWGVGVSHGSGGDTKLTTLTQEARTLQFTYRLPPLSPSQGWGFPRTLMLGIALLLRGLRAGEGRVHQPHGSGDWEPQGQPSHQPKFQTCLRRLWCSQEDPVSPGLCHKEPCPSSSSTPQRPHTVQGGLFSSVTSPESHKHPCEVGRKGTMITFI